MKRFYVACLIMSLTGCGWIYGEEGIVRDRANDYLKATTEPRMQIPEGVPPNSREQDYLTIPALGENANAELQQDFEIPKPPALLADKKGDASGDDVSLKEMQTAQVDQAGVSDKYNAQLVRDENQHTVLKLTGHFEEIWDAVGESIKINETEIVDLDRSKGVYYVKAEDVTVKLTIKEADGNVVVVSVEEDVESVSEDTRQQMLTNIKAKLPQ